MKPQRLLKVCLVLLIFALPPAPAQRPGSPLTEKPENSGVAESPLAIQAAISAAIGQEEGSYKAHQSGDGLLASNPAQGLEIEWNASGLRLRTGANDWQVRLASFGYGENQQKAEEVAPQAQLNRVEYRRGLLTEWYLNGPMGLEQGFTLEKPPGDRRGEAVLTLTLAQGGSLRARLVGDGLALTGAEGGGRLHYGGLAANDSEGRALPAWIEMQGELVLLRVDDREARYPLIVDPFIQGVKLTAGPGGDANDQYGYSVALSADGNTAIVGAPYHRNEHGTAYIFKRSGTAWSQQAQIPRPDDTDYFGNAVALSGDGNTALISGGLWDVFVFVRSGAGWSQQEKFQKTAPYFISFGDSLALSDDGNTALIGAPDYDAGSNADQGTSYIYVRSGTTWSEQTILSASDGAAGDWFGGSVSLSADGNKALVGARSDDVSSNADQGSAYVFTRSGTSWSQQTKLVALDGAASDEFGISVGLSGDGNTALIGSYGPSLQQGSAYVFTHSGTSWIQQAKLSASDGQAYAFFGCSVALSSDGNTALVGAHGDPIGGSEISKGSAYVFTRSGTNWSQQAKLLAADGAADDSFGYIAALSADGNTALIGAPEDDVGANQNQGSAYIFTRSDTIWSQQAQLVPYGRIGDRFGSSVALSADGNTLAAGYPGQDIHVLVRSGETWSEQARLIPLDGVGEDTMFGYSVALSADGNTVLAGDPWLHPERAYVFVRSGSTWSQEAQLAPPNADDYSDFGNAVALSADGNTAIVGDYTAEVAGVDQGSAYVFVRSGTSWSLQAQLMAADGAAGDEFGYSVALNSDGNTALIGARSDDVGSNTNQGSAYLFLRSGITWSQHSPLHAADGLADDYFGNAVALDADGNTALIGARLDDVGSNTNQGSAYIFVDSWTGWVQQVRLNARDGAGADYFGRAVALSADGDQALVGVYGDDVRATDQGSAYIFRRSGESWNQVDYLTASDGLWGDRFGYAVALNADGTIVMVGAPGCDEDQCTHSGAVYPFTRLAPTLFLPLVMK